MNPRAYGSAVRLLLVGTLYMVIITSQLFILCPQLLHTLCCSPTLLFRYVLLCYHVTLLPCYLVTLLSCYSVTLLPCCTLLQLPFPCHSVTLFPPPPPGGLLLGILGRGVPPDSPNRDPFSDQNMPFFFQTRFLKSLKNYTRFKTIMVKIYTRLQTKTAQKPYPLGRHISI